MRVAECRETDDAILRDREGDRRRQIDEARTAGLQSLGAQIQRVVETVVAPERAHLDRIAAGGKLARERTILREACKNFTVGTEQVADHAVAGRERDL